MERDEAKDGARRATDTSKFLIRESEALVDSARELVRLRHEWHRLRLGRICERCLTVQQSREFDDDGPCEPRAS